MDWMIQVTDLVKRYRQSERNAVDGISFNVREGEFFTLLGPNGAGKTTTISILTTTLVPTSGEVCIADYNVLTQASQVRRQVGIIFQNPSLDLNLTAEENVRFHAVLYGLYPFRPTYASMPAVYRQQIARLAEVLGLEKDIFKPVRRFSGGMKRKLEIMRSLIHNPKVLFLDEPTIGLDPASRRNLWEYLTTVRAENHTTVLLTTHYMEEAEQADRICIINLGKIVALGTPAELKQQLASQAYLKLDTLDHEALRAELVRLNFPFVDGTEFRVSLAERGVQEIIKAIQTPLTSISTHIPTVEDAYLSIVEADDTRLISEEAIK